MGQFSIIDFDHGTRKKAAVAALIAYDRWCWRAREYRPRPSENSLKHPPVKLDLKT